MPLFTQRSPPPAVPQGVEDILRSPVLAFREAFPELADHRPRHSVALQPADQLLLVDGKFDPLQVAPHIARKVPSQELHGLASSSCVRSRAGGPRSYCTADVRRESVRRPGPPQPDAMLLTV